MSGCGAELGGYRGDLGEEDQLNEGVEVGERGQCRLRGR